MSRPHRWVFRSDYLEYTHCARCYCDVRDDAVLKSCPVVTASDAFAALEFVLGQVWRAEAWYALDMLTTVQVGDSRLCICPMGGGEYEVYSLHGAREQVYGRYAGCAEARVAALDLIARLGDE